MGGALAECLDQLAIELLRVQELAMNKVAEVVADSNQGQLFIASPARKSQGQVSFVINLKRPATGRLCNLRNKIVLKIRSRADDVDSFEGPSGDGIIAADILVCSMSVFMHFQRLRVLLTVKGRVGNLSVGDLGRRGHATVD